MPQVAPENDGQLSRDIVGAAINRAMDDHCGVMMCNLQAVADVVEQRDELYGALKFIMAFYEEGQTALDTNAWKCAEAAGRKALAKASGEE